MRHLSKLLLSFETSSGCRSRKRVKYIFPMLPTPGRAQDTSVAQLLSSHGSLELGIQTPPIAQSISRLLSVLLASIAVDAHVLISEIFRHLGACVEWDNELHRLPLPSKAMQIHLVSFKLQ